MKVLNILKQQSLLTRSFYPFSLNLQPTKDLLKKNLYKIDLINKSVNRQILSMAYSPGVGAICEEIKSKAQLADTMTLRGRSIAIVSDGSMLNSEGQNFMPVMDWLIAQIKYYSGYDAFPFVILKGCEIQQVLKDLSTCYGTVLLLDERSVNEVPSNILLLRQHQLAKITQSELTDVEKISNIISYLIENNFKGEPSEQDLKKGLNHEPTNFKEVPPYDVYLKDGRDLYSHAIQLHEFYKGKIHVQLNFFNINKIKPFFTEAIMREIVKEKVYCKTAQLSAIVTDGTAVLGYGNIGPTAGLPVMEGKSLLFKLLGDVEVVPVCIHQRKNTAKACKAIMNLLGHYQAINLEDFKAPECFQIEEGLQKQKVMPIFHDDQHGTAIVTLAGLINGAKVVSKNLHDCKMVINGAGAAGITIGKLLLSYGVKDIIICDSTGAIYRGREKNMNAEKRKIAEITNKQNRAGSLKDVIKGTDVFIGVSIEGALNPHWVTTMNKKSIVLAMANPIPQIMPDQAKAAGAYVYGSGRSDLENQINNSLVFPGIFKAIMQHSLKQITQDMKIKAAEAIAECIVGLPRRDYIIPDSLDKDVALKISQALQPKK